MYLINDLLLIGALNQELIEIHLNNSDLNLGNLAQSLKYLLMSKSYIEAL